MTKSSKSTAHFSLPRSRRSPRRAQKSTSPLPRLLLLPPPPSPPPLPHQSLWMRTRHSIWAKNGARGCRLWTLCGRRCNEKRCVPLPALASAFRFLCSFSLTLPRPLPQLAPVDHSSIAYLPFKRCLYLEHPDVSARSEAGRIARVRAKIQLAKDLDGIDTSNIIDDAPGRRTPIGAARSHRRRYGRRRHLGVGRRRAYAG